MFKKKGTCQQMQNFKAKLMAHYLGLTQEYPIMQPKKCTSKEPIRHLLSFGLNLWNHVKSRVASWFELSEVGCSWGAEGLLVYVLFSVFFSSRKCTPRALDQSCKHQVSLPNLSLKAIIIRSLGLSHRGNMRSAFIRQMEHGWSRPQ